MVQVATHLKSESPETVIFLVSNKEEAVKVWNATGRHLKKKGRHLSKLPFI